jgi:outer membrane protein TolC
LLGPGNLLFTAAASLTQPIFDNGLHQGDLDLAKGRFAELIADYRKAVLQAFTDVDNALTAVRYTAEQEALERTAVDVAQHASDIARAQLAAGTIDITTLLNTQAALYTDQDTLASVRLTHFQALINLYQAVGGGFTSASASGTP